jgi:hypothetical protein
MNAHQPDQTAFQPGQYVFRAGQHSAFDLNWPSFSPSPSLDSENYSSSEVSSPGVSPYCLTELFMQDDELATQTFSESSKSGGTSASQREKMRLGPRLSEMADAMRQMTDAIRSGLPSESPKSNTGDSLTRAITLVEQDGGLTDDEIAEVACYFEEDPYRAKAYISLMTPQKRFRFLRYELESHRKNV